MRQRIFALTYAQTHTIILLSVDDTVQIPHTKGNPMIKLECDKMAKVIEKAKALRPRVTVIDAERRTYAVTGSKGAKYVVQFSVVNGAKLGACDCEAGLRDKSCYHLAAAYQANVMVQSMRQAPAKVERRVEHGHNGTKLTAVYCEEWAI